MAITPESNYLLVPGGSFNRDSSGNYTPAPRMKLRANAVIEYYNAHRQRFEQPEAFIALSGSHQEALGQLALHVTEAGWYLETFDTAGIPPRLHEGRIDHAAVNTADNLINLIESGFDPTSLSPENPLLIPVGDELFKRISAYTDQLGFPASSVARLETGEKSGPLEPKLLKLTRAALQNVAIGDVEGVRRASRIVAARIRDEVDEHIVAMAS